MYLYRDVVSKNTYYLDEISRIIEFNSLSNAFEIAAHDTNDALYKLQTACQFFGIAGCMLFVVVVILEVKLHNLRKRVTALESEHPLLKPILEV